jgi:hypothetical protein
MKTKCSYCDKEMEWKDIGAITVPTHSIYRDSDGQLKHGRSAIVFCSDECANSFTRTMTGTAKDLGEYQAVGK